MFKLYECDVGIKINGVTYNFDHVNEVQAENPERNRLTRGANASNKQGLTYKDGLRDPKRCTIPIMNMSLALKTVLDDAYENQTRLDVFAISRKTGASKYWKDAILSNLPEQLTMDETAESLAVSLEFESFNVVENYKE